MNANDFHVCIFLLCHRNMSKNLSSVSAFLKLPQVNLISQVKAC